MKFYVGAPLRHWESARKAMSALRSMGHEVTHDWTLEAEEYFKGLSNVSNRRIANDCIGGESLQNSPGGFDSRSLLQGRNCELVLT